MESIPFNGLLVLKFYSDTCAPCKRMNPILDKMNKEFSSVKIYSVNIDDDYKLAKKFRIMSVPTLVFMNGDTENQRIEGLANTEVVRKTFKGLVG